jgi:hypothetical protein
MNLVQMSRSLSDLFPALSMTVKRGRRQRVTGCSDQAILSLPVGWSLWEHSAGETFVVSESVRCNSGFSLKTRKLTGATWGMGLANDGTSKIQA